MVWGFVAAAGASLAGSLLSSKSSKKAADAQAQASQAAIDEQRRQFDVSRRDLAPYQGAGVNALMALMDLQGLARPDLSARMAPMETISPTTITVTPKKKKKGLLGKLVSAAIPGVGGLPKSPTALFGGGGGGDSYTISGLPTGDPGGGTYVSNQPRYTFQGSPGYQFRLDEGMKAIDRGAAARGLLNSGSRLKALTSYGQNLASEEFGNEFNRLAALAGVGQAATNTSVGLGQSTAGNIGSLLGDQGAARASGYVGQANAINSGISSLAGLAAYTNPQWFRR